MPHCGITLPSKVFHPSGVGAKRPWGEGKVMVETVRNTHELRAQVGAWRAAGHAVGLVPTMGGLHEGHLSLVRRSLARTERTCVTLFVNPKQFGPGEDFVTYPRNEERDRALLAAAGAHLLFAPGPEVMYPPDFVTTVSVPGLGDVMEGEVRPGFMTGVATVVAKLLLQAGADVAFFGEKDYQQLLVVQRMVADLCIPVTIAACPTVREDDGLAMSSRNAYLSAGQRTRAPALYRVLREVADDIATGSIPDARRGTARLLEAGFQSVDYVALRDAETLAPVASPRRPARVLGAAWLGSTRLIDNVAVQGS